MILKNLIGSLESLSNQKQNNKIPLELENKSILLHKKSKSVRK